MWVVWFLLGVAVGGAVMHMVVVNDNKQRLKALLYHLWVLLDYEDRYPTQHGATQRLITGLLDEIGEW